MFEEVGLSIEFKVGRDGFISFNVSGKKDNKKRTLYPGTNSLYTHRTGRIIGIKRD